MRNAENNTRLSAHENLARIAVLRHHGRREPHMDYRKALATACLAFLIGCLPEPDFNTVYGYAGLNGGTTGGAGADAAEVAVCNGVELLAALNNPDYAAVPLTVWVDGTITPHNSNTDSIPVTRGN